MVINKIQTQRIIFVAREFRKEVTSTVFRLLSYNINIKCFKAVPYALNDELFLTIDQIIPTDSAEDYIISMANKNREDLAFNEERRIRDLNTYAKFWNLFE